jgi:uncharacterized membrane protein
VESTEGSEEREPSNREILEELHKVKRASDETNRIARLLALIALMIGMTGILIKLDQGSWYSWLVFLSQLIVASLVFLEVFWSIKDEKWNKKRV